MGHRKKSIKRSRAKTILRLPDLEQSKNAVLNSLAAASSQESYGHAIDEFIGWYCSEPRLAFVVLSSVIDSSSNKKNWRPRQSMCA
jgi:hypothetical protein